MDILYLLILLSAVLVLLIVGLFGWAVQRGQFDDVEREGHRILDDEGPGVDAHQVASQGLPEQSQSQDAGAYFGPS